MEVSKLPSMEAKKGGMEARSSLLCLLVRVMDLAFPSSSSSPCFGCCWRRGRRERPPSRSLFASFKKEEILEGEGEGLSAGGGEEGTNEKVESSLGSEICFPSLQCID